MTGFTKRGYEEDDHKNFATKSTESCRKTESCAGTHLILHGDMCNNMCMCTVTNLQRNIFHFPNPRFWVRALVVGVCVALPSHFIHPLQADTYSQPHTAKRLCV